MENLEKLINDGEKAENKMCDYNYQLLLTIYFIKYDELSIKEFIRADKTIPEF